MLRPLSCLYNLTRALSSGQPGIIVVYDHLFLGGKFQRVPYFFFESKASLSKALPFAVVQRPCPMSVKRTSKFHWCLDQPGDEGYDDDDVDDGGDDDVDTDDDEQGDDDDLGQPG